MTAPDGRVWTVTQRRFRRPGWRGPRGGRGGRWSRYVDFMPFGESLGGALVVLAVVVALLAVGLVVLPALVFGLELVAVAVLASALGRRWVVAETDGPPPEERAWRLRGRRRAEAYAREVARALEAAGTLPAGPRGSD